MLTKLLPLHKFPMMLRQLLMKWKDHARGKDKRSEEKEKERV